MYLLINASKSFRKRHLISRVNFVNNFFKIIIINSPLFDSSLIVDESTWRMRGNIRISSAMSFAIFRNVKLQPRAMSRWREAAGKKEERG